MDRLIEDIDYPKTVNEWWLLFEHNLDKLMAMLPYHPYYQNKCDHKISATAAEAVCEAVRARIAEENNEDPEILFNRYRESHDGRIGSLLNAIWFGLPESYESRSLDGFGVLCDLCSESYLLYDEENENG